MRKPSFWQSAAIIYLTFFVLCFLAFITGSMSSLEYVGGIFGTSLGIFVFACLWKGKLKEIKDVLIGLKDKLNKKKSNSTNTSFLPTGLKPIHWALTH